LSCSYKKCGKKNAKKSRWFWTKFKKVYEKQNSYFAILRHSGCNRELLVEMEFFLFYMNLINMSNNKFSQF